jgi:hypothetical protein
MNRSDLRQIFRTICKVVQAANFKKCSRQISSSMLAMLLLGGNTQAQSQARVQVQSPGQAGDWRAVQNLTPGTEISVKTQRRYRCVVEKVTEDELVCEAHGRWFRVSTLVIRRSEINEARVRPRPNQAKDAWIGAGIGAGAGAIAAGTSSRDYPGFHAFVGGAAGAGGGALVGGIVPIFQILLQRGKVIYKR